MFTFKSIFHWPWTLDADRIIRNGRSLEMLAVGIIVYTICYGIQRIFNFLIYERYITNSVQQFIDICSMSNISMFLFAHDAYGYYIHGRYVTILMIFSRNETEGRAFLMFVSGHRMASPTRTCAQCYNN